LSQSFLFLLLVSGHVVLGVEFVAAITESLLYFLVAQVEKSGVVLIFEFLVAFLALLHVDLLLYVGPVSIHPLVSHSLMLHVLLLVELSINLNLHPFLIFLVPLGQLFLFGRTS
jgi:hypothetical protein